MAMPTKEEIGKLIPFYLRDNGMTIDQFASLMNVSSVSVYNWVSGHTMRYKNYIELLSALRDYY